MGEAVAGPPPPEQVAEGLVRRGVPVLVSKLWGGGSPGLAFGHSYSPGPGVPCSRPCASGRGRPQAQGRPSLGSRAGALPGEEAGLFLGATVRGAEARPRFCSGLFNR